MAGITARTRYPGNRLTTLQYEGCMLISPLSDRDDAPIITEDIPEDPEARFWSVYNHLAKGEDDDLTENWDKDMDVLLIYVRVLRFYHLINDTHILRDDGRSVLGRHNSFHYRRVQEPST